MKKQRVISQLKGQNKAPEKLNEVERGNLPEKEFRIMIVKVTPKLRKTVKKMQEVFTKDLELKNKWTQTNNIQEGINRRKTEVEEWINDLEDRMVEITAVEQNIEKRMKKKKPTIPLG